MSNALDCIRNGKEVIKKLERLKGNVKKTLTVACRKGAKIVLLDARRRAPKRTGLLRRNIRIKMGKRKKGRILVRITNTFKDKKHWYGIPQEYGWTHHKTGKHYAGVRYMREAGRSNRQKVIATAHESVSEAVRKTF